MNRLGLLALSFTCVLNAQTAKQPFDFRAMMTLARVSEPALSPDGKLVAFTVRRIDLEKNGGPRHIYVVPTAGGTPVAIAAEGNNERAQWTPDSKRIVFTSTRSGSAQLWVMGADGANPKQLTNLSTEAGGAVVSADGRWILFQSEVDPACADDACNKAKLEAEKANPVKARAYTSLLYRHWDSWQSARRKHLFVMPLDGGTPRDLTPGVRDIPPFSLGGPDDYAFSPDGKEVCFAMNPDPDLSTSTNAELYVIPVEGGVEPRRISTSPGADLSPRYSPDGKYLAWRSQDRAGFESDRWKLVVMPRTGDLLADAIKPLTDGVDRPVESFAWMPDSTRLAYVVSDRGKTNVQLVAVTGGGARRMLGGPSHVDDVQFTPDGKTMIFSEHSGSKPMEIYRVTSAGGAPENLSRMNAAAVDRYQLTPMEEFTVEGAERTRVHSFLVKPYGYDAKKKYPVLFLIHGGPQGAWGEAWSYRWNPQVFAAAGFAVVMPNPRGSTGYGQRFTDEVSDDWGGRVYDDIMAVVDHVAKQPWANSERFAAAGGSYGGYMVNWMLGHTDRFRAFVSHAGVYDLKSMGGETEELWFTKWEFKGLPWENPESYQKWSPSNHVPNFRTPTLVIHGEQDFRVPHGQGLQLFTGLQQMKVPSKLLLFPDEGHWILKPRNSELWYRSFLDWVTEFTQPKAAVR
jgi:dipeptidyl aminopeptidase/acylaminoacyl peptidase